MKIDKETLLHISDSLLLEFTDEELELLQDDFDVFLSQYDLLSNIKDIDKETPISFPYEIHIEQMNDNSKIQNLDKKEALRNAKEVEGDFVVVDKVVK